MQHFDLYQLTDTDRSLDCDEIAQQISQKQQTETSADKQRELHLAQQILTNQTKRQKYDAVLDDSTAAPLTRDDVEELAHLSLPGASPASAAASTAPGFQQTHDRNDAPHGGFAQPAAGSSRSNRGFGQGHAAHNNSAQNNPTQGGSAHSNFAQGNFGQNIPQQSPHQAEQPQGTPFAERLSVAGKKRSQSIQYFIWLIILLLGNLVLTGYYLGTDKEELVLGLNLIQLDVLLNVVAHNIFWILTFELVWFIRSRWFTPKAGSEDTTRSGAHGGMQGQR